MTIALQIILNSLIESQMILSILPHSHTLLLNRIVPFMGYRESFLVRYRYSSIKIASILDRHQRSNSHSTFHFLV